MGGAVSLALAALHPDKIAKTAIFSPLLKVKDQKIREFCQLAGQFGAHECWWYPEMPFPLSCFVAVDVFSRFVHSKNLVDVLAKKIPTLAVFTEIDDVADVSIGQKFFADLCSISGAIQMQTFLVQVSNSKKCNLVLFFFPSINLKHAQRPRHVFHFTCAFY
jgi:pimeloyl-ACP methyl ester carboxylesterase